MLLFDAEGSQASEHLATAGTTSRRCSWRNEGCCDTLAAAVATQAPVVRRPAEWLRAAGGRGSACSGLSGVCSEDGD